MLLPFPISTGRRRGNPPPRNIPFPVSTDCPRRRRGSTEYPRRYVTDKARESFETTAKVDNPAAIDILNSQFAGLAPQLRVGLSATVSDKPCGGCKFMRPFCDARSKQCVVPNCTTVLPYCDAANSTGRLSRAFCPKSCGCEFPLSPLALSLPSWGCAAIDTAGSYQEHLAALPCEDVSPAPRDAYAISYDDRLRESENETRWSLWLKFLDKFEEASRTMPLEEAKQERLDIKYLRRYGCERGGRA